MGAPSRVLVVANPTAGTTSGALIEEVTGLCRAAGRDVTVHRTTRRGDATETIVAAVDQARPPELVIVIGGDGTVCEVAEGLLTRRPEQRPNLFAVPGGTGNSGYRMLWGWQPWQDSLAAVLAGRDAVVRHVDMARLAETDDLVLLGACAGLFADALITAKSVAKKGWARYEEALAITADRFVPFTARTTVDDVVLYEGDIVLANVGGGRHRAGQYQLLPHSLVDDGRLDVCVIGSGMPTQEALELTRDGKHVTMAGVSYGRGSRIIVERLDGAPMCYEHDGEVLARPPHTMTLDIVPHVLPMWAAPATGQGVS